MIRNAHYDFQLVLKYTFSLFFVSALIFVGLQGDPAIPSARSSNSSVQAHTISPYYKDYLLYAGEGSAGAFTFTNTNSTTVNLLLSASKYNPEESQFISDDQSVDLVSTAINALSVLPGATVDIPYQINVPLATPSGSYFYIVYLEEEAEDIIPNTPTAQIRPAYGMIVALHVVEQGGSIKGAFTRQSQVLLSLLDRGFPILKQTRFEYQYINESQFVFTPTGEIRVYNSVTNERLVKERLNSDENRAYPGDLLLQEYSYQLRDFENIFHDLKIVTRTYNQFDDAYLEQTIVLPGVQKWSLFLTIGTIGIIFYSLSKRILAKRKNGKK